ncbi:zinc ribbon domain-containing protein [Candidatus Peregrinibacteria bacterium]|nr:zinc ribbon domain-containing protein [Candidatus Peregrinibacteria bacterium]
MPIFEFECAKCHTIFEELVLQDRDMKNVRCLKCNSKYIKRLMSGAHFSKLKKCGKYSECMRDAPCLGRESGCQFI